MKASYQDMLDVNNSKAVNESRDGCFAVITGLHIERTSFYGPHGSSYQKHWVGFYDAQDCHNLFDGSDDFCHKEAFMGGFLFDTIEEANELFNFNVTSRVCDVDAHNEDLFNRYNVRF